MPLGIVYVTTRLQASGHDVDAYDFEMFLDLVDPEFNQALHEFIIYPAAEEEENGRVLFINRLDTLLETLFGEPPVEMHPILGPLLAYAERFAEFLLERGYELILFSTYNSNLFFSLSLAQALKRRSPSVKTVFGGPAVSFPSVYEFLVGTRLCDYCVVGEGEVTVLELVRALERGEQPRVPGVAYHNGLRIAHHERAKMPLEDLDLPVYDSFPFEGARPQIYSAKTGYFALPISASRGCTLRCAFCAETNFWKTFRARDPRAVVDEMERLSERYGSRIFHICDSLVNAEVAWLDRFCDELCSKSPGFLINFAYCQARNLTQELIEKMAQAGFRALNFGVESGSDPLLKKMHKATKSASIKDIIMWSLRAGLMIDFPLLRNLPGETREDVWNTIEFVSEIEQAIARENPPGGLVYSADTNFRLEAMSGIFRHPENYGVTLEPFDLVLPKGASHLAHLIRPMLVRWENGVPAAERRVRSRAMSNLKQVRPIQKYSPEDCLEWVDLRYRYALMRNVRLVERGSGGSVHTRFGEFRIGNPELTALRSLKGSDPRTISQTLSWSEEDVKLLLANFLAIGAIRTDASPYLLGNRAWPALQNAVSGERPRQTPASPASAGSISSS